MNASKKTLALVVGGAFATGLAASPVVNAAGNPFEFKPLSSGYMVADSHEGDEKMQDGKCGSGKCGTSMKKKAEEKAKEGNCSAEMKDKEGKCSAEMKAKAEEKAREGNCGASK